MRNVNFSIVEITPISIQSLDAIIRIDLVIWTINIEKPIDIALDFLERLAFWPIRPTIPDVERSGLRFLGCLHFQKFYDSEDSDLPIGSVSFEPCCAGCGHWISSPVLVAIVCGFGCLV